MKIFAVAVLFISLSGCATPQGPADICHHQCLEDNYMNGGNLAACFTRCDAEK